jgi:hypothetical protein
MQLSLHTALQYRWLARVKGVSFRERDLGIDPGCAVFRSLCSLYGKGSACFVPATAVRSWMSPGGALVDRLARAVALL